MLPWVQTTWFKLVFPKSSIFLFFIFFLFFGQDGGCCVPLGYKFVGVVKAVSPGKVQAPSSTGVSLLSTTGGVGEAKRARPHSESPEDTRKQRALDYSPALSVSSSDAMSQSSSPGRSEPLTESGLSKEEADETLRAFKEQCEELTREHFAALKKLSDSVRTKLAIGGVCLGDGEKKELLKGALYQGELVVSLFKDLQGDSVAALTPSPKRIVGVALLGDVSIFVGGIPREAEEAELLKSFPPGAQIVNSFRGGKGKFGFLEVSVHSEDADGMVEQKVFYLQRKLRG